MRNKLTAICFVVFPLIAMAQTDCYAIITDPNVTNINRVNLRSTFTSYTSRVKEK